MAGRKPAKNFIDLYPGWPNLDASEITDIVDMRFLLFVHRFREIFKTYRASAKGSSIKDFSDHLNMSVGLIHGLLNGEKFPSLETVLKLEKKLGCTLLDSFDSHIQSKESDISNHIH